MVDGHIDHDNMAGRRLTIALAVTKSIRKSDHAIVEAHQQIRRIDELLDNLKAARRATKQASTAA